MTDADHLTARTVLPEPRLCSDRRGDILQGRFCSGRRSKPQIVWNSTAASGTSSPASRGPRTCVKLASETVTGHCLQASSSFSFDVSSSRLESPDDSSLECLAGSDVESEDELSESEIVDIPPPEASTVTSSTTFSAGGKLERSLSRSWSRHRLRNSAGRAPLGSSQADQARAEEGDGYGTFLS
jgi:hypothetical protein